MLKRGIAFLVFWPVRVVPTNGVPKFAGVVGVLESNGAVDESVHAPRFDEPKLRSKCVARASNSGFRGVCFGHPTWLPAETSALPVRDGKK